ncbi:sensor histidine kinase KdpD [Shewanella sp. SR44-3]|uniref:sensor histidine kinase n=1 Tax=Shewanella sp. SR44-3 TaxID=2760936 RepID=UPI0015F7A8F4|nr:HAMP domain-containing sensor histidine kinase [Shewanella sp. SR44-3]MBB1269493.1 HAMP domain-containing histidine kinase [Shewanella sp. SR44-3]
MTIKSIKNTLVNTMTYSVSAIVVIVFLAIDINIDNWIDKEFDSALTNKANYLKTLVKVTNPSQSQVEFDFADEFMPEFSLPADGEYFQLWQDGKEFERSDSLLKFKDASLIKPAQALNTTEFYNITLPDGRSGRAIVSTFTPQIPQDEDKDKLANLMPMQLTLAVSKEELSNILIIIDTSMALGLVAMIVLMRLLMMKVIDAGLRPLNELNQQLKSANIKDDLTPFSVDDDEFIEIEPIKNELNRFTRLNQQHLLNEKRITADIAHELKTPISELINLSEMHIRYPNDVRISTTYKQDVLSISLKMKNIVSKLLLLQQAAAGALSIAPQTVNLRASIEQIIKEQLNKHPSAQHRLIIQDELTTATIKLDAFSIHCILSNLIDNALFYSPDDSEVFIRLKPEQTPGLSVCIEIENQLTANLSDEDLEKLTMPLYQLETSRSNPDRHGLGLSIVDKIAKANNFDFSFNKTSKHSLVFSLNLPIINNQKK